MRAVKTGCACGSVNVGVCLCESVALHDTHEVRGNHVHNKEKVKMTKVQICSISATSLPSVPVAHVPQAGFQTWISSLPFPSPSS